MSERPTRLGEVAQRCTRASPSGGIPDLVADRARETPDAPAIITADGGLTYRELVSRSGAWADTVRRAVTCDGARIGISLPRTADLVCAMLGVMRAGYTYVPIDPAYPAARVAFIEADAHLDALVTDDPRRAQAGSPIILPPARNDLELDGPQTSLPPADVAFVLYTSGSTGTPKGVQIRQRSVTNLVEWAAHCYGPDELACVAAGTSVCFDLSVFELFAPLTSGGSVRILHNSLDLADDTMVTPVTLVNTVPSVMRALLRLGGFPQSVLTINLAGETLDAALVHEIFARAPGVRVLNLYGPTETTTYSTYWNVIATESKPPIGRPIDNTDVYILNEALRLAEPGAVGELYISGEGVAAGYLNRPALTEERFRDNHLGSGRLYRTGDLARWREGGLLEHHGRADDMVKLRGYRVEPGEIEAAMLALPTVSEAVVVVRRVTDEDLRLTAFYVPTADGSGNDDVPGELRLRLPEYLIPSVFISVREFPRLPNGKVDRAALARESGADHRAPGTAVAETVEGIVDEEMRGVLGASATGRDFFAAGGDSLMAARLVQRLRVRTGRQIEMADVLRHPSPAALANAITSIAPLPSHEPAGPQASGRPFDLPLTSSQAQMCTFERMHPGTGALNVALSLEWEGPFDEGAVRRRCAELVARHAPLASAGGVHDGVFAITGSEPRVERVTVPTASAEEAEAWRRRDAIRPFNLAAEPPWRVTIAEHTPSDHTVLLTFHHSIIDAASIGVILEHFAQPGAGGGVLDDRYLQAVARISAAERDVPEQTEVSNWPFYPRDFPRRMKTFDALRLTTVLPPSVCASVARTCRSASITPYIFWLETCFRTLAEWSGDPEVAVGSVFTLRESAELEGLLGFYATVMPLTFRVDQTETRASSLAGVASLVEAAHVSKRCRADVVHARARRAGASQVPLFDVMFGLAPRCRRQWREGLTRITASEQFTGQGPADLNFSVDWQPNEVPQVTLDFDPSVYAVETAQSLIDRFSAIAADASPKRALRRRPPAPRPPVETPNSISEAFESRAIRDPDATAVSDGTQQWTYAQILARSRGYAESLRASSPDSGPVGLLVSDRTTEILAILAAMRTGRPWVLLDPHNAPLRRLAIVQQAGLRTICADADHFAQAAALVGPDGTVVDLSHSPGRKRLDWPPRAVAASSAYAVFTSGSTGAPKGVVQSHRNLLAHIQAYVDQLEITAQDRLSLLTTPAVDAGIMDVFAALLSGASLHVRALLAEPLSSVRPWIDEAGISVLHLTPSVFRVLVRGEEWEQAPASLRFVVLGGEAVYPSDLRLFDERFHDRCRLINGYGPTECTVAAQAFFVPCRDRAEFDHISLGQPVDGVSIALAASSDIDEDSVGEIEISSDRLFAGYIESPGDWDACAGAPIAVRRWRTGDLARRQKDGTLAFVGRRDDQVKIGGVRVEPREIEQAVLSHPEVVDACVLASRDIPERISLIAYLVARPGCDLRSVTGHLRDRLPPPMLPILVAVSALPRLANGKIDRAALPGHGWTESSDDRGSRIEVTVAETWKHVLGLARMPGPTDGFIESGGHSLAALRIAAKLCEEFGVDLAPARMLTNITVRELARVLVECANASPEDQTPDTPRRRPVSPAQERFWLLEQLRADGDPSHALYFSVAHKADDEHAVVAALNAAVDRHDVLRSRYRVGDGGLIITTDPPHPLHFERLRVDGPLPDYIDIRSLELSASMCFDLEAEWPIRAALIAYDDAQLLLVGLHHIAADAPSIDLLRGEVMTFHRSGSLPPAAIHGAASVHQDWELPAATSATQRAFWVERLRELPPDSAFTRGANPGTGASTAADRQCRDIAAPAREALVDLSRTTGVSLPALLLAAFSVVMSRRSGADDLLIGMPVTTRRTPPEERVVGALLNVVLIRCRPVSDCSFIDYARGVQREIADAVEHSLVPLQEVVNGVARASGGLRPTYELLFSYHQIEGSETLPEVFGGVVTCPLAVTVAYSAGRLHLDVDGARRSNSKLRLQLTAEEIETVVAEVGRYPAIPLGELAVLSDSERHELLVLLNRTRPLRCGPETVIAAFERHCVQAPDDLAVEWSGGSLSYARLEQTAAAIARRLRSRGVQAGSLVPVWGRRGPEFLAGILGVLKCGAAFVPLDPRWPPHVLESAFAGMGTRLLIAPAGVCAPCVDLIEANLGESGDPTPAPCGGDANAPIYAMHTSGTTGRPKAVLVPRRGIENRFAWMSAFLTEDLPPVVMQTTAPIYDSSVWQLLWPLTLGGRTVIPDEDVLLDADALSSLVESGAINVIDFTPSLLSALLPGLECNRGSAGKLRSLAWVIIGGEEVTARTVARLRDILPHARITNLYGPTEGSIGCVFHEVSGRSAGRVPIGRPIPNVRVVLVDDHGRLTPRGAVGELVLAGDCVALGYLGSTTGGFGRSLRVPELDGQARYATGDLCRWNDRGELEYHGRKDRQLKIRGVRVEADAVRIALESHPSVVSASITVRGGSGGSKLVATIEPEGSRQVDPAGLREFLRGLLPPSHVPDVIAGVETPVSDPVGQSVIDKGQVVPEARPTEFAHLEHRVAHVWSQVLGLNPSAIGRSANFFDVGGTSLQLIDLKYRLGSAFSSSVGILDLFRYPTVSSQAELMRTITAETGEYRR